LKLNGKKFPQASRQLSVCVDGPAGFNPVFRTLLAGIRQCMTYRLYCVEKKIKASLYKKGLDCKMSDGFCSVQVKPLLQYCVQFGYYTWSKMQSTWKAHRQEQLESLKFMKH